MAITIQQLLRKPRLFPLILPKRISGNSCGLMLEMAQLVNLHNQIDGNNGFSLLGLM